MSEFESRERAFEKKFELDEEQRFRTSSHAAHLFGLWIAGHLSMTEADAEAYSQQAVATVVAKSGHSSLIVKSENDLKAKGIEMSQSMLEKKYAELYQRAGSQIAEKV